MSTRYTPEQAQRRMEAHALLKHFSDDGESVVTGRATFKRIVRTLIVEGKGARGRPMDNPDYVAREITDQYCERTGIMLRQDLVEDLVKEVLDS